MFNHKKVFLYTGCNERPTFGYAKTSTSNGKTFKHLYFQNYCNTIKINRK